MESYLISNLKKQLRDQRNEITKQQMDNDKLKRDIKKTKFNELEIELAQYMDECQRLRMVLEE